jgi:hypothetical protein
MKIIFIALVLFLSACASNKEVAAPKPEYTPITDIQLAFVAEEIKVGKLLYKKDKLAADATDFLFEKNILPNDSRIRGWVVDTTKELATVYFMGSSDKGLQSYHAVIFSDEGPKYVKDPETTELHRSMFKARMLGMDSLKFACSERYNTVVIDGQDSWIVYVLAATTENNIIMAGGHHKVTVSKATDSVLDVKPLSKSCLKLQSPPNSWPMMTHIVDSTPIATHVFLSLLHNKTVYVGTETGVWKAENGNLSLIK